MEGYPKVPTPRPGQDGGGGYPKVPTPQPGRGGGGYPKVGTTPPAKDLLHGGQYASCVHAGLSFFFDNDNNF